MDAGLKIKELASPPKKITKNNVLKVLFYNRLNEKLVDPKETT
jgi:hypothetical protein